MAQPKLSSALTFLIELLAAIPSVILGLMGIFVLVPVVKTIQPFLIKYLGFIPLFKGVPYGVGMLTAGIILSIMILPYITTISRDVILSVPRPLKEGALALGATHWETVKLVILPYSRSAIFGSVFLALGRALGETMAVTMVIGNTPKIALSLFEPAYTMSAVLANEFAEATSDLHVSSLIAIALILFCITIIVNGAARLLVRRMNRVG
jgi:phosphate transport system permease protein